MTLEETFWHFDKKIKKYYFFFLYYLKLFRVHFHFDVMQPKHCKANRQRWCSITHVLVSCSLFASVLSHPSHTSMMEPRLMQQMFTFRFTSLRMQPKKKKRAVSNGSWHNNSKTSCMWQSFSSENRGCHLFTWAFIQNHIGHLMLCSFTAHAQREKKAVRIWGEQKCEGLPFCYSMLCWLDTFSTYLFISTW